MSNLFLDTSALAKRYMSEKGTIWIRQQTASSADNTLFIAQITPVELYSAISRQYHSGEIKLSHLKAFRRLIIRHIQNQYLVLSLDVSIIEQALTLQESYRLRAYDAIQLASALKLEQRLKTTGRSLTFLTADVRLLTSAHSAGLSTDNPGNYT
jgi:hypothetical protein